MKVLLTGVAGFIGLHVAKGILKAYPSAEIISIDNLNSYYDVSLKHARLKELGFVPDSVENGIPQKSARHPGLVFQKVDLQDKDAIREIIQKSSITHIVHLAAQAGVRFSLEHPQTYIDSNVTGFLNILESCRDSNIEHLVFASSSSVYGINGAIPFNENLRLATPASVYAASKIMDEMMAHSYSYNYQIPISALRYFTVYGPWGRPDMAPYIFAERIASGKTIVLNNHGQMLRDFTYINDVVDRTVAILRHPPKDNPKTRDVPFIAYNVGNGSPVNLFDFVDAMKRAFRNENVSVEFAPMPPGDVKETWADTTLIDSVIGYSVHTPLQEGLRAFAEWFLEYNEYGIDEQGSQQPPLDSR